MNCPKCNGDRYNELRVKLSNNMYVVLRLCVECGIVYGDVKED